MLFPAKVAAADVNHAHVLRISEVATQVRGPVLTVAVLDWLRRNMVLGRDGAATLDARAEARLSGDR
jgi:hypothetical protein